jgi:fructose-bisphosphate aldolase / 2-amino-3,7-dideoxy-D-threo-hept-6-ulosonate synthase
MVLSPEEAMAMAADVALASCNMNTSDERTDMENVKLFSEIVRRKRACGLPVVGEVYPTRADSVPREEIHDEIVNSARILSELGADGVKTFYTGRKFREAVVAASVPVLALGAGRTAELKALQQAYDAVNDGARGVFYGRNVTLSNDPQKFLAALLKVVKKGVEPSVALHEAGL